MQKLVWLLLLSGLFLGSQAQQRSRKAIFIIVDGIAADALERESLPNIKVISQKGHYFRAWLGGEKGGYSQTPTISAVGYNTVLTGTWANKHNVWDNDIDSPNYSYPTIFRLLKDQYPEKKIAVFSSWLDNRTKLVGDGLPSTRSIRVDVKADGFELDTVRFPHDQQSAYMEKIDQTVAESAAAAIRTEAPDLSWVYLEYTDDMGHRYGDAPQYSRAIKLMDEKIGLIWKAIEERRQRYKENWLIFITTDHGRDAVTGRNHGGQSYRERSTWIVTNQPQINSYAKYFRPSAADILPSITQFMQMQVPLAVRRELDGQSLFGPVAFTQLEVHAVQQYLDISWMPLVQHQPLKIWLATTNRVKQGGSDDYVQVAMVDAAKGAYLLDVSAYPSGFYKVVVEGGGTTLNRWVLLPANKSK